VPRHVPLDSQQPSSCCYCYFARNGLISRIWTLKMKKSEFFIFPDEVDVSNEIFTNLQVNIENINKNRKNQKALVSSMLLISLTYPFISLPVRCSGFWRWIRQILWILGSIWGGQNLYAILFFSPLLRCWILNHCWNYFRSHP
jgi:hypothetical protein